MLILCFYVFTFLHFAISNFAISNFAISNFAISNFAISNFAISNFPILAFWDFGILAFCHFGILDLGSGVRIRIRGSEILDLGVQTPDLGSERGNYPSQGVDIDPIYVIFRLIPE
jgi:hypothetical protein